MAPVADHRHKLGRRYSRDPVLERSNSEFNFLHLLWSIFDVPVNLAVASASAAFEVGFALAVYSSKLSTNFNKFWKLAVPS